MWSKIKAAVRGTGPVVILEHMDVSILWEPRDLWVGLYWCTSRTNKDMWSLYLVTVPTIVLKIDIRKRR